MIRAIHERSDGSTFLDDVAQYEGKNYPFRSCKDYLLSKRSCKDSSDKVILVTVLINITYSP
jgi:hypothetical protein